MAYRTTRKADADIFDLYVRGVAAFGEEQAERYFRGLLATFELLADNPRLARERGSFDPPVRIHAYESHLIIYVLEGDDILIVRVLHARQEWEQYL